MMDRTVIFTLAITTVVVVGLLSFASMKNTQTKAEARVSVAQEHTKRAEGRHEILDVLGLIRKDKQ